MKNFLIISLLSLMIISCKKEEDSYSDTPSIEFVSISPSTVKEFEDEVMVTIKYQDGNGDLGENDPDVKNLFITDSRNNVIYTFRIQQLAPNDANIIIEGELDVKLSTLSVVGSASSESATFSIYVQDRAGNKSNVVTSTPITVSK